MVEILFSLKKCDEARELHKEFKKKYPTSDFRGDMSFVEVPCAAAAQSKTDARRYLDGFLFYEAVRVIGIACQDHAVCGVTCSGHESPNEYGRSKLAGGRILSHTRAACISCRPVE